MCSDPDNLGTSHVKGKGVWSHLLGILQPLSVILLLITLIILGPVLHLPLGSQLLFLFKKYCGNYGYFVVMLAAFAEGLIVVNTYAPGSTVVILGAVAARSGILSIWGVIATALFGFMLGYISCFALGLYGWYSAVRNRNINSALERVRNEMALFGPKLIVIANIHPNTGSLAATAAGLLRVKFRIFLLITTASALFWTVFWCFIAYSLGDAAVLLFNSWLLLPILLVVCLAIFINHKRCSGRSASST